MHFQHAVSYQETGDSNIIDFNAVMQMEKWIYIDDYCQQINENKTIQFDLSGCEYVDSLALGHLLILREKLKWSNKQLQIINANKLVQETFSLTKFDQLFEIN